MTCPGGRYLGAMSHPIEAIATTAAPPAIGPYSQAIRAGDLVSIDIRTDDVTLDLDSLKKWEDGAAIIQMEMQA